MYAHRSTSRMYWHPLDLVSLLLYGFLYLTASTTSTAQSTYAAPNPIFGQTGLPEGASFEGAQENVNLNNGNVHVSIPLLSLKGMAGFDFNLALLYDSKTITIGGGQAPQSQSDGTTQYIPPYPKMFQSDQALFAGGRLSLPGLSYNLANISFNHDDSTGPGSRTWGTAACKSGFEFIDETGAAHTFVNFPLCENIYQPAINVDDASDGSLYRLDTTNLHDAVVTSPAGLKYHFDVNGSGSYPYPFKIADTNGNTISYALTGVYPNYTLTVTDTQNRAVIISRNDVSYRDSDGIQRHIVATSVPGNANATTTNFNYCQSLDSAYLSSSSTSGGRGGGTNWTIQFPPNTGYSAGNKFVVYLDEFFEIWKIQYPTGGYTSYVYQNIPVTYVDDNWRCESDTREIQERHVCSDAGGACSSSSEAITTYSASAAGTKGPLDGNVSMEVTDPAGNRTTHTFNEYYWPASAGNLGSKETDTVFYAGQSVPIKRVHYEYDSGNANITYCSQPVKIVTTMLDGKFAPDIRTDFEPRYVIVHPGGGNEATCGADGFISKSEYGFSGELIRKTEHGFLQNDTLAGGHLLDRITDVTTSYNVGTGLTVTTTQHTDYDTQGNIIGVTDSGTGADQISVSTSVSTPRDSFGRAISSTDGNGNTTTFHYDPAWNGSDCQPSASPWPTLVTNALKQSSSATYNPCTGSLHSSKDANSKETTYNYDALGRTTSIGYPDGGSKSIEYDPGTGGKVRATIATGAASMVSTEFHDGIGRVLSQQLMAPEGVHHVDSSWDKRGLQASISVPYVGTPTGSTQFTYDALGRPKLQCNPDNGTQDCSAGSSYRERIYSGNQIDLYDETRRHTRQQFDGAGRMTDIWEPDASGTPNLHAKYTYNGVDSLTGVVQYGDGSRTVSRSFTYDGLNRLATSSNPESGTICYGVWSGSTCTSGYDLNGNLQVKTDARRVVTSYRYDALNRITSKSFSGPDGNKYYGDTTCYAYDDSSVANAVGRLTAEWTQRGACPSSTTSVPAQALTRKLIGSYDVMGRVLSQTVCAQQNCTMTRPQGYTYDLAGNLKTYTDGAGGQVFTQSYDSAGRLFSLSSNMTDATHPATLLNIKTFDPFGWKTASYGNGMGATRSFDVRGRVAGFEVKAGAQ